MLRKEDTYITGRFLSFGCKKITRTLEKNSIFLKTKILNTRKISKKITFLCTIFSYSLNIAPILIKYCLYVMLIAPKFPNLIYASNFNEENEKKVNNNHFTEEECNKIIQSIKDVPFVVYEKRLGISLKNSLDKTVFFCIPFDMADSFINILKKSFSRNTANDAFSPNVIKFFSKMKDYILNLMHRINESLYLLYSKINHHLKSTASGIKSIEIEEFVNYMELKKNLEENGYKVSFNKYSDYRNQEIFIYSKEIGNDETFFRMTDYRNRCLYILDQLIPAYEFLKKKNDFLPRNKH
ncbi:hypothetical protein EDEG_00173 [Edhazardia aedis USNM 41457]|uniref:Uncharacterized protein n=1 Tax=Edhazardia aedis (strain USNM 41457) TaxID=1003232 RepID=J9DM61_EDHAE|nr:hypothetical protein EDEG_00173 [Edhazardia aedis USNM 41457]|eukprot:EJW03685.1 hypothetical protein EDEG_00173 [Edhazardia aedis USNM 41457]